jgi:hypothetical protein
MNVNVGIIYMYTHASLQYSQFCYDVFLINAVLCVHRVTKTAEADPLPRVHLFAPSL